MTDKVIITNWEEVVINDFYLSNQWNCDPQLRKKLMKMANDNELYVAYIAFAVHYCIFQAADCLEVFIDDNWNVLLECETYPIKFPKDYVKEYLEDS